MTLNSTCGHCGHWHWFGLCAVCPCPHNVFEERQQRVATLVTRGMSQRAAYNVVDAAMSAVGCIPETYHGLQAAQTT